MTFLRPEALLLLLLVPVVALFLLARNRARHRALSRLGQVELISKLIQRIHYGNRRLKEILWLTTLTLLIFALARPIWGIQLDLVDSTGVQIVFAIDVSRSMDAEDIPPSRLARALFVAQDILDALPESQVAVSIFARQARPYMPMTYDHWVARAFLSSLSTQALTMQGTQLAEALKISAQMLDMRLTGDKFIILLSDGEDHEAGLQTVLAELENLGIRVLTLGFGTSTGALIPIRDAQGNPIAFHSNNGVPVETRLNEAVLQQIARETQGLYASYSLGAFSIQDFVQPVLSAQELATNQSYLTRPVEQYQIFVLIAWLLLTIEILLSEVKRTA